MAPTGSVLISGASRGIGRAVADLLAAQGRDIVGMARTAPTDFPGHFLCCDFANAEDTARALAVVAGEHRVAAVVNNVGASMPQRLEQLDLEMLQRVLDLNLRSAIQVTQACLPSLIACGHGRIVNICSRAIFGSVTRTAYAAAKAGLVGCTKTWALELGPHSITANAIAPGAIDTALFRATKPVGSEAERHILSGIPLGRFGQASEIAAMVAFLLSQESGYITGQVICVDGGASLGGR